MTSFTDHDKRTKALATLPAYRWTDWILALPAVTRLPLVFLFVGAVVAIGFLLTHNLLAVMAVLLAFSAGMAWTSAWVILAQGAQHDLSEMGYDELATLAPGRITAWVETLTGTVIGVGIIWTVIDLRQLPFSHVYLELLFNGLFWSMIVWAAVTGTHMIGFLLRQHRVYLRVASTMTLRLSQLQEAQTIANPSLRFALLAVLIGVMEMLLIQFVEVDIRNTLVNVIFIPTALLMFLAIPLFVQPVLILRSRIRKLKRGELSLVRRAIAGDRSVLSCSELGEAADDFTLPDLMYYEDRISRIWEWPIQQHWQRLLFYTLIPPVAWIMAALVERSLDLLLD